MCVFCFGCELRGADMVEKLQQLQEQNQALQEQLRQQQRQIEALSQKVEALQSAAAPTNHAAEENEPAAPGSASAWSNLGKVHLSGEGGVAFFDSGSHGQFPHGTFRVDEARLFVEAPVLDDVFFYGEVDLATREEPDVEARLGELYLDVENVSRLWGCERMLSLRAGRIYIPFGEEYQNRFAIDNPLISHSLSDLWGVDEGVELYGEAGKFNYVVAVQNGGVPDTQDFDGDKSVAGRVGYDPCHWLHLSLSGMRTGDLDVNGDRMSAMWFGNGFFRSLGSPGTTKFHVNLVEGDVALRWSQGHLKAFGGGVFYDDNDPTTSQRRDVYYYSVEGVNDIVGKLYGAVRFSQILAGDGFPVVGNADFGEYMFRELTRGLWRLSLGLGYRWSPNLVLKAEYSFEEGRELDGEKREHQDLLAFEAAFRF